MSEDPKSCNDNGQKTQSGVVMLYCVLLVDEIRLSKTNCNRSIKYFAQYAIWIWRFVRIVFLIDNVGADDEANVILWFFTFCFWLVRFVIQGPANKHVDIGITGQNRYRLCIRVFLSRLQRTSQIRLRAAVFVWQRKLGWNRWNNSMNGGTQIPHVPIWNKSDRNFWRCSLLQRTTNSVGRFAWIHTHLFDCEFGFAVSIFDRFPLAFAHIAHNFWQQNRTNEYQEMKTHG